MSDPGTTEADLNGDGVNDAVLIDADGDGLAETTVSHNPSGGFDVVSDTDGDGIYDTAELDNDGDGMADTFQYDTNADGVIDVVDVDVDADGFIDVSQVDTDGDGSLDTTFADANQDGIFDTTATDLDGDGVVDVVEYDEAGDGQVDTISIPGQTLTLDESGHVVDITTDPVSGDPYGGDPAASPTDYSDPTYSDPTSTAPGEVPQSDSGWVPDSTSTDETGTGDPPEESAPAPVDDATERAEDALNWFEQSENGFCVPASVAQIVAEYSDEPITDETVFVQRAIDLGYLTYDETGVGWSGLTIEQGEDLLESFGVEASIETSTVDELDAYLDQGYNAIAYIDSSVVWTGDAPDVLDHAVTVSSIENGMVYLNDPGTPDGELEAVPVEVFEAAWSASSFQMIMTDNPDMGSTGEPGVGPDVYVDPTTAETALAGPSRGTILLPIVLSGDEVQAWHLRND